LAAVCTTRSRMVHDHRVSKLELCTYGKRN
jgi:hypothetical protein